MASPLLLADAVRALRVASLAGGDGLEGVDVTHALRGMVLPGAVERLTKVDDACICDRLCWERNEFDEFRRA